MKRVLMTLALVGVAAAASAQPAAPDLSKAKLKNPASLTEKAPETFKAKFDTSKGPFVIEVHRTWAPEGA